MNLSMEEKQRLRCREQTCDCQGPVGKDGLGVWDQQMQTIINRMDKQQGPTVYHRELNSISLDKS